MKTKIFALLFLLLVAVFLISGCGVVNVKELKENPEKYFGKEIYAKGIVKNTIKIGSLSGFSLTEGNYSIPVKSDKLPAESKTATVQGTLMKEALVGYYIYAKKFINYKFVLIK
ncbi:MAG: hypothetical protein N3G19_01085 [Candidatus Pacearchaeota archaeon]|nr:hypothetical protein [Candidatus Pacearchaeota archaeon]